METKKILGNHKIKLKELVDIRTGVKQRELNELRKDVKNNNDKQLYKKYDILKSIYNLFFHIHFKVLIFPY